ncbi:MAG: tetratricopeptide repeat protein, partial [Polyangiaceae bacterium]
MVRSRGLLCVAFVLTVASSAGAQDFDPRGRHHAHSASRAARPAGGSPPVDAARGPGPTRAVLIERYTRAVLSQPGASFPIERLAQLVRERDGQLDALVKDFDARAARPGAEQYAATLALAALYRMDGRSDAAVRTYEKGIALGGKDAAAIVALARLHQDRGEMADARQSFERALSLQTSNVDKEMSLRALMVIALDGKDWQAAMGFHRDLCKLEPESLSVRGELGHELYNRGQYALAEAELEGVVKAAAGDNRVLATALKDLGRAQAKAHDDHAALATLNSALATAGAQTALRAEIYGIIAEIYRGQQRLPDLIKDLAGEHPGDFTRLSVLGGLY